MVILVFWVFEKSLCFVKSVVSTLESWDHHLSQPQVCSCKNLSNDHVWSTMYPSAWIPSHNRSYHPLTLSPPFITVPPSSSSGLFCATRCPSVSSSGLFPLCNKTFHWHPTLNWTPVPIFSVPRKNDSLMAFWESCAKRPQLIKDVYANSEEVQIFEKKNQNLIKFIQQVSEKTFACIFLYHQTSLNYREFIIHAS